MNIHQIQKTLSQTEGKDKLAKLIQFSSYLLANMKYKYKNLDNYNKFLKLSSKIIEARQLIRFGLNII